MKYEVRSMKYEGRSMKYEVRSMNKGFTLLEVIIAIMILTLAIGGSFMLIHQTLASYTLIQSRLIASYLIQEGIEVIRKIRDSNWLKEINWDEDLPAGSWEADYNDSFLTPCSPPCHYDNLRPLKINGGFYNYDLGRETKFRRKITISDREDLTIPPDGKIDRFKISVTLFWKERGKLYQMRAQEFLYNWKP